MNQSIINSQNYLFYLGYQHYKLKHFDNV